jgi:malate dehydrogenase (oxaloacetate-decarboxylating)
VAIVASGTDPLLSRCRTLLETQAGLRVITADSATAPADALLCLDAVRQAPPGVPVVTAEDTTAIALAAALTTTLARAGARPRSGHVVIAGADTLPLLFPLVMLGGIGQVTKWNRADALAFPLHAVAADAGAVIDLIGATDPDLEPPVITPNREGDTTLALPGLLQAVADAPSARLDIEVHRACVLALVMATPPTAVLPQGPTRELTERVAGAAATALRASEVPSRSE